MGKTSLTAVSSMLHTLRQIFEPGAFSSEAGAFGSTAAAVASSRPTVGLADI